MTKTKPNNKALEIYGPVLGAPHITIGDLVTLQDMVEARLREAQEQPFRGIRTKESIRHLLASLNVPPAQIEAWFAEVKA